MGLREVLQARAAFQGRTAEVACGELGLLTVEALPLQEAEALFRGADAHRAVFYAACRELQAEGDAMHRAGKLYAPDGIMRFVSDSEAAAAARVVLELSGLHTAETGEKPGEELPPEETGSAVGVQPAAVAAFPKEASGAAESRAVPPLPASVEQAAGQAVGEVPALPVPEAEGKEAAESEVPFIPVSKTQGNETAESETPFFLTPDVPGEMEIESEAAVPPAEPGSAGPQFLAATDRVDAGGQTAREPARRTETAPETVWAVREETAPEEQTELRQAAEMPGSRKQSFALPQDDGDRFARHLLEGLRRAKWVRGE